MRAVIPPCACCFLVCSLPLVLADGTAFAQSDSRPESTTASPTAPTAPTPNAQTKPDRAQTSDQERIAEYFAQCLKDWDAGTHMTKKEWHDVCRRVVDSRAKFRLEKGLGIPETNR